MNKKLISILTGTYNEEENVDLLIDSVEKEIKKFPQYDFEYIFIDNCSTDKTVEKLKLHASTKKYIKIIVNAKNFGHIRSPYYGLLQCKGDAVISIVADLQDPPKLIPEIISKWEEGYKIVACIKNESNENKLMYLIRGFFYKLLEKLSEKGSNIIKQFTGFGLYDKSFIEIIKKIDDPYPYFRGMVSDLGFNIFYLKYTQEKRYKGKTKNNFFTLYDMAMLGFVNHSKIPLRLAALTGFITAILSLIVAFFYFIFKLIYWDNFQAGTAPIVIGIFFFSAVQLFFIGIVGEYIGAIHTQVRKRPYVVEKERINFD